MKGNVFELTTKDAAIEKAWDSVPDIYLEGPDKPDDDADFGVIRGWCSHSATKKHFRCATRRITYFHFRTYEYGFRVMVPIPA